MQTLKFSEVISQYNEYYSEYEKVTKFPYSSESELEEIILEIFDLDFNIYYTEFDYENKLVFISKY